MLHFKLYIMFNFIIVLGINIYWFRKYGENGWKEMYDFNSGRPEWMTALTWAWALFGIYTLIAHTLFSSCC